jgi:hypothetical protein
MWLSAECASQHVLFRIVTRFRRQTPVIIRFHSSGFAQTILDRAFGARRSRPTPNLQPPTRNPKPVTRNLSRQVGLPQDGEIGIGLRCHAKGWVELAGLLQIKVGFLRLVELRMIAGQVKMYRRAIWK